MTTEEKVWFDAFMYWYTKKRGDGPIPGVGEAGILADEALAEFKKRFKTYPKETNGFQPTSSLAW